MNAPSPKSLDDVLAIAVLSSVVPNTALPAVLAFIRLGHAVGRMEQHRESYPQAHPVDITKPEELFEYAKELARSHLCP